MIAGKDTEMYNKGYMDGYNDAEKAHIDSIKPKLKGSAPDYWTRLEHQYAGMAMQGLVTRDLTIEELADISVKIAQALAQKLKKEDKQ